MRSRVAALTLAATCAAGLLAGCGGSSSSTRITGTRVSGADTDNGAGYSISVPAGWKKFTASHPGRHVVEWGDLSTHSNLTIITVTGVTRISARASENGIKTESRYEPANTRPTSLSLAGATVPGASSASVLTEALAREKPANLVTTLFVTTHSGTEYEVEAQRIGSGPFASGSSDGTEFLKSFRLTSGS